MTKTPTSTLAAMKKGKTLSAKKVHASKRAGGKKGAALAASKSKKTSTTTTTTTATEPAEKKKHRRHGKTNQFVFDSYIYKLHKRSNPGINMSMISMKIMNNFVNDMFHRICRRASDLVRLGKHQTLKLDAIEAATKTVVPGELATYAVNQGTKAVLMYAKTLDEEKKAKTHKAKKGGEAEAPAAAAAVMDT